YSACANRKRATLDEAVADAVKWLRQNQGVGRTGVGRAKVKERLEAMQTADANRPSADRHHRLITQKEFFSLCRDVGNVSSPPRLIEYLHNTGTLFYRKGLFGDRIILDQAWALDAVYAVFDRKAGSYPNIMRNGGLFRRSDLSESVWKEHR